MKPKNSTLFIIGILFVAFNLRAPFCIGLLYDRTNSWTNPFLLFLLIILGLLFSGMQAGAGKKLFQEDKSIAQ